MRRHNSGLSLSWVTSAAAMGDGYCAICAEVPRRKVYWSEFDIPAAGTAPGENETQQLQLRHVAKQ